MFKKILVPLDGSAGAEHAIFVAGRIARASSAKMLLVRVVEVPVEYGLHYAPPGYLQDIPGEKREAADYLKQVALSGDLKGIEVETAVVSGSPAMMILEVTKSFRADLIVMCSRSRTGFNRWTTGRVAEKLVRYSNAPVLLLRDRGPVPLAPIMVNPVPLRAVVALDGSKRAEEALLPTAQLLMALAPDAPKELHLLQIVEPVAITHVGKFQPPVTTSYIAEAKKEALDHIRILTQRIQKKLPAEANITISSTVAVNSENDVASAILKEAERGEKPGEAAYHGYHLVAMATHGRGGFARWMLGSITERVLHHTCLPLFVIRPAEMARRQEVETNVVTDELRSGAKQRADFGSFPAIL